MSYQAIVQTEHVTRHLPQGRRELYILNGISFQLETGAWLALTSPSGSGKSTLLGILAGIDRPYSGRVFIEGLEISALPEGRLARLRNERIGIIFQSFHLIPTLTALENVEVPLYIHPQRWQARHLAAQLLAQVGLTERLSHYPNQLSGGERQRVAIARARVCGLRLLLADEPTGNLDSATSIQVLDLIAELRRQFGLTVIMVTHDPAIAARADPRLHLVEGHLVGLQAAAPAGVATRPVLSQEARS